MTASITHQGTGVPRPVFSIGLARRWELGLLMLALSMVATIVSWSAVKLMLEQQATMKFNNRMIQFANVKAANGKIAPTAKSPIPKNISTEASGTITRFAIMTTGVIK